MEIKQPVRLAEGDWRRAGLILGRAFTENPGMKWIFPDPDTRQRRLAWLLGSAVRLCCRASEGWCFPGVTGGVAGWLPPGKTHIGFLEMLSAGFALAPVQVGLMASIRASQVTAELQRIHHAAEPAEHWYLYAIGVEPELQGKGYGSALMRCVLARADAEGQRCYLETDKPEDIRFYEKHGFRIRSELRLVRTGPTIWTMGREPRPVSTPSAGAMT
jgi:ribosomal protein S18 acetylase RimI-like enzyme